MLTPKLETRFASGLLLAMVALVSALTPACAMDGAAPEGEPAGSGEQGEDLSTSTRYGSGFAYADQPTNTAGYTTNSAYSWTTATGTGAAPRAMRVADGTYQVDFPGLYDSGGNVQVNAVGSDDVLCKVLGWGRDSVYPVSTTLRVRVRCHDRNNVTQPSRFTVLFAKQRPTWESATNKTGAYAWVDDALATSSTPSLTYQYNSTGLAATVTQSPVGTYRVTFPGQTITGGSFQVTAYGAGGERCSMGGWSSGSGGTTATVFCTTHTGAPVSSQFDILYMRSSSPISTDALGYAWANEPTTPSYTPDPTFQYDAFPASGYTARSYVVAGYDGAGAYHVDYPRQREGVTLPFRQSSFVTRYAWVNDGGYCKTLSMPEAVGTGARARVKCFDKLGAAAPAQFDSLLVTNQWLIPG